MTRDLARELTGLDAIAQAELVRRGDARPLELLEAAIERLEAVNPKLGAVVTPLYDRARGEATSPDLPDGPFRGVPFLLKDLVCCTGGDPYFMGSRALREAGFKPQHDSFLAEQFRSAGLVSFGKTNTPEFGFNATTEPEAFGPSRNPWNLEHSTGGSSGGSAAAVAARVVPMAHANDGGGSIRIPASECGLVGLKPSRGRISAGPDYGESWHGLATEGVVSLSVRDTATALDCAAEFRCGDPYTAPPPARPYSAEVGRDPGGLRIGLMSVRPDGDPLHPECVAAVEGTGRLLESLGHSVESSHPAALEEAEMGEQFSSLLLPHAARNLEEVGLLLGRTLEAGDVERYTWHLAEQGRELPATAYIAAMDWLHGWSRRVQRWWADGFDLLVTPTIAEPPPRLGWLASDAAEPEEVWQRLLALIPFTPPYNVTGQPAISLPLHCSREGLPVGVQLVAAYGREDLLIRTASQLEAAKPWIERRPGVCA